MNQPVNVSNLPALEVHNLTVSYRRMPVLWSVGFSIPQGKITCVVGPNGAGKSTLLKAVMGLLPVDSGRVLLLGKPLGEARRQVSYLPQRASVDWDFPICVGEVVMMGRYPYMGFFKRPSLADQEKVTACLARVGMERFADTQIGELSGGQQQRVFIARALAQDEAQVYLMDEPMAAVDAASEQVILATLAHMAQEGKTVIVVHHDLTSAQAHFSWGLLLNVRLIASGPSTQVFTPELLQEAYGSHLTLLSKLRTHIEKADLPIEG